MNSLNLEELKVQLKKDKEQQKQDENIGNTRFDDFAMGVKKQFRPDWLESENGIFINKLNFASKNFEQTFESVKNLKYTVYKDHRQKLDDYEINIREQREDQVVLKSKVDSMESNLPQMIREMVDECIDGRVQPIFDQFVQKQQLKEQLSLKMDFTYFKEYLKKQQQMEASNDKEIRNDERFFKIERQLSNFVDKEDFSNQIKSKANIDKLKEITDSLLKIKSGHQSIQEKYERDLKKLDAEFAKKTSNLSSTIQEIGVRLKVLEQEINEDDAQGSPDQKAEIDPNSDAEGDMEAQKTVLHQSEKESVIDDIPNISEEKKISGNRVISEIQFHKNDQILLNQQSDVVFETSQKIMEGRNETLPTEQNQNMKTQKSPTQSQLNKNQSVSISKGSVKQPIRSSRDKKKFADQFASSGIGSASKSPEGIKKGKKKSQKDQSASLDKEAKEALSQIENKIEELRKQTFNEINRLEAVLEQEQSFSKQSIDHLGFQFKKEIDTLQINSSDQKKQVILLQNVTKLFQEKLQTCVKDINMLLNRDTAAEINKFQQKLIKDVLVDLLTPIKLKFNVELNQQKSNLEEVQKQMSQINEKNFINDKLIDNMNVSVLRSLKNYEMDNQILNKEIQRLQEIDRLKVSHANDVFYNPNTGSMLPSLDSCQISVQDDLNTFITKVQNKKQSIQNSLRSQFNESQDYFNQISERDVVTQNELKGICERMTKQPSKRQRIIITKSSDPINQQMRKTVASTQKPNDTERSGFKDVNKRQRLGSLNNQTVDLMNQTIKFKNDSKMSIQEGIVKKHGNSIQGPFIKGDGISPFLSNVKNQFTFFSSKQDSDFLDFKSINHGSQNASMDPLVTNLNEKSKIVLQNQQLQGQTKIYVDLLTPELPNAMDRIKQKITDKKIEQIQKQKRLVDQMEESRIKVLEKYDLKSRL